MSPPRKLIPIPALVLLCPLWAAAAPPFTEDTLTLLDDHPGLQALIQQEKVVAFYGVPIAENDGVPPKDVADFLDDWLFVDSFNGKSGHKDALGVPDVELVFYDSIVSGDGRFKVFRYRQTIDDLNVVTGLVTIPVLLAAEQPARPDTIGFININLVGQPEGGLRSENEISATEAVDIVEAAPPFEHLTVFSTPDKVVYETDEGAVHRTWRFRGNDDDEGYLFFVDTTSEAIVGVHNLIVNADVSVTVTGYSTPCCHPEQPGWPACCPSGEPDCCCLPNDPDYPECAFPCCGADNPNDEGSFPVEMPMSGVLVEAVNDQDEVVDEAYADATGLAEFTDLTGAVGVQSRLVGEWVQVVIDEEYSLGEPVEDAVALESQTEVELVLNHPPAPPDWPNTLATPQVNAFVAIQKTHDWFSARQSTFTEIDQRTDCVMNWPNAQVGCNAAYTQDSDPPTITCRMQLNPPGVCNNPGFSTIVSHEYGHLILDQRLRWSEFYPDAHFHEGFADVLSMLTWDADCLGANFFLGGRKCIREMEALGRFDDLWGFTTAACAPDGCEVQLWDPRCPPLISQYPHCSGLPMASAFWDLQKVLRCCVDDADPNGACLSATLCADDDECGAGEVCTNRPTEDLLANFLLFTNGRLDERVLIEVLMADDDDMDLTSTPPTPHFDEIFDAFVSEHGWAAPHIGGESDDTVHVGWDVAGDPPLEGADYLVYYNASPPYVILKTTVTANGDQVREWSISREDGSGNPLDLGAVYADWQLRCVGGSDNLEICEYDQDCDSEVCGSAANVTVFVGDGTTDKCRILHIIDIPTQSSALPEPTEANYSSIRLELDSGSGNVLHMARLTGRAECFAGGNADGGRISGSIERGARGINAEAIGEGASTGGVLSVGTLLGITELKRFPAGSTLEAGDLTGDLAIDSDFLGTIAITGDLAGRLTVTNATVSTGNIHVDGSIVGHPITGEAIYIEGDMYGDIVANADSAGTGEITGKVTVTGLFQGNICADNLAADEAFPANIDILLGREATICGQAPDYTVNESLYVIYVDDDATGGNINGSTWEDAYTSLQDALDDADSPSLAGADLRIWVAQGTYWPSDCDGSCTSTDREETFTLVDGLAMYGGLVGDEHPLDPLDDRDVHTTILSGDLEQDDSVWLNRSDNSFHVVTAVDAGSSTVLDGFVITGGNANGLSPDYDGGGMYLDGGAPILRHLMFVSNYASRSGGGLFNFDALPTIINCVFNNNHSNYGGALANFGTTSTVDVANCTLTENFAANLGGAIYNAVNGMKVTSSTLTGNYMTTKYSTLNHFHGIVAPDVTYSCVEGGYEGEGNEDCDPMYTDADGADNVVGTLDDDLRPSLGSPCIDAGNNETVPSGLATDLDGRERFINDTCKTDTGSGGAPIVDMGAYESEDHGCPTVTGATSKKNHGTTAYTIDEGDVECREGGITKLVLNFDMPTYSTDADELAAGDFTLSSGSVTSVTHLMNAFGQPFLERYVVNVSGVNDDEQFILEFSAENDVGYETEYDLCWTALEGDVNGDGVVDGDDETELGNAANPVTESNFRADLDHNNTIEGDTSQPDWQVWSANEEDTAAVCE